LILPYAVIEDGVEDEKRACLMLEQLTSAISFTVCVFTVVRNIFAGLECTQQTQFDLILIKSILDNHEIVHKKSKQGTTSVDSVTNHQLRADDVLTILRNVGASMPIVLVCADTDITQMLIRSRMSSDQFNNMCTAKGYFAMLKAPFTALGLNALIERVHARKQKILKNQPMQQRVAQSNVLPSLISASSTLSSSKVSTTGSPRLQQEQAASPRLQQQSQASKGSLGSSANITAPTSKRAMEVDDSDGDDDDEDEDDDDNDDDDDADNAGIPTLEQSRIQQRRQVPQQPSAVAVSEPASANMGLDLLASALTANKPLPAATQKPLQSQSRPQTTAVGVGAATRKEPMKSIQERYKQLQQLQEVLQPQGAVTTDQFRRLGTELDSEADDNDDQSAHDEMQQSELDRYQKFQQEYAHFMGLHQNQRQQQKRQQEKQTQQLASLLGVASSSASPMPSPVPRMSPTMPSILGTVVGSASPTFGMGGDGEEMQTQSQPQAQPLSISDYALLNDAAKQFFGTATARDVLFGGLNDNSNSSSTSELTGLFRAGDSNTTKKRTSSSSLSRRPPTPTRSTPVSSSSSAGSSLINVADASFKSPQPKRVRKAAGLEAPHGMLLHSTAEVLGIAMDVAKSAGNATEVDNEDDSAAMETI
jgi:hypothetical protein